MASQPKNLNNPNWPNLSQFPLPAKTLASALLLVMAIGMLGAIGQIIVHDIIPTFFSGTGGMEMTAMESPSPSPATSDRGDLFNDMAKQPAPRPEPKVDRAQFVWLLKWTHIHLFGMNILFILLGCVTIFLNLKVSVRAWLVALPFVGVLIDIAAMWLKAYVSQAFFWMHMPGGGLFGAVFLFVFFRGMHEMWGGEQNG